ncbi:hypothetical protein [Variovorax saccharolyticus]|uniref:hypothetical protein n=1 Tax=Variovorax saccharolyticus TaxID=3053516 RepID=UPI00257563BA|nr:MULTISPECIES: hypothetical protein [unclassified Variovorax]MDM0022317.1 hypothetical protein [Variovorax sp. J22R187]
MQTLLLGGDGRRRQRVEGRDAPISSGISKASWTDQTQPEDVAAPWYVQRYTTHRLALLELTYPELLRRLRPFCSDDGGAKS